MLGFTGLALTELSSHTPALEQVGFASTLFFRLAFLLLPALHEG